MWIPIALAAGTALLILKSRSSRASESQGELRSVKGEVVRIDPERGYTLTVVYPGYLGETDNQSEEEAVMNALLGSSFQVFSVRFASVFDPRYPTSKEHAQTRARVMAFSKKAGSLTIGSPIAGGTLESVIIHPPVRKE